jgi:hypothetical protein
VFNWFKALVTEWPAHAQLDIMAIAYAALGLLSRGKPFGKVPQWCNTGDFDEAAQACREPVWSTAAADREPHNRVPATLRSDRPEVGSATAVNLIDGRKTAPRPTLLG